MESLWWWVSMLSFFESFRSWVSARCGSVHSWFSLSGKPHALIKRLVTENYPPSMVQHWGDKRSAKRWLGVLPFVILQLRGFMIEAPGVQMYGKVETTTTTTTAWEKQARGESLTATCWIYLTLPNYEWTSDLFAVMTVSTCCWHRVQQCCFIWHDDHW